MATFVSIIVTLILFGVIILIHELGHFLVAKASGIKINEFSIGMGPTLFKRKKGVTQYSVRAFPIGGYVSMEGEDENSDDEHSFNKTPLIKRMAVVLAGACMNFILGIVIMGIIVGVQGQVSTTKINTLESGSAAQHSGLQKGDQVVKVNGHHVVSTADMQFQLSRIKSDEPINLVVKRNGKKVVLDNLATDTTESGGRKLGITLGIEELNPGNFISTTFGNTVFYAKLVWTSLTDLITGQVQFTDLSGPIGVAQAVNEAQSYGFLSVLSLFGFITINVGVFNLMPFPALDGGRFVFLIIEAIRRKPVKKEIEGYVNAIGFGLLILLMILVTAKDVIHLF